MKLFANGYVRWSTPEFEAYARRSKGDAEYDVTEGGEFVPAGEVIIGTADSYGWVENSYIDVVENDSDSGFVSDVIAAAALLPSA